MVKPNGYDEAQIMGQQKEAITPGGHHLIIKQVNETMSKEDPATGKTAKPMIVVLYDFAQNDSQAGLLMKEFKDDDRADKKWPYRGSQYIMVQDFNDSSKTSRAYKTFCTCYEQSNNTKINWTDDSSTWANQFKNKKIGGCFGVVHDVYQGRETVKTELRWFISDNKVEACDVPMERLLSENKKKQLSEAGSGEQKPMEDMSFVNIPEGGMEELPFN